MGKGSRKFGFSWSWKRASGLSAAKGRISKKIGIPLTQSGRRQKTGRLLWSGLAAKDERPKPRRGEVAVELDEDEGEVRRGGGVPLIAVVALVGLAAWWFVFRT
jgi:hypothetical protein